MKTKFLHIIKTIFLYKKNIQRVLEKLNKKDAYLVYRKVKNEK